MKVGLNRSDEFVGLGKQMQAGWLNLTRKPLKWRLESLYRAADDPVLKSDMSQLETEVIALFRDALDNRPPSFKAFEAAVGKFQRLRAFTLLKEETGVTRLERSLLDALSDRLDKVSLRLRASEQLVAQSDDAPVGWSEIVARLRPAAGPPIYVYETLAQESHLERAAESSRQNATERMRLAAEQFGGEGAIADRLRARKRKTRQTAASEFADVLKSGRSTAAFALTQACAIPGRTDKAQRAIDANGWNLSAASDIALERAPALAARYAAFKARKLKVNDFAWYDVPTNLQRNGRKSWRAGLAESLSSLSALHPDLAFEARQLIADGAVNASEGGSAYTYPLLHADSDAGKRRAGPFVRAPYDGTRDAQLSLAHELGHAAHQLAARDRGPTVGDPGLALAETGALASEIAFFNDDDIMLAERDFAMLCRQPALAAFEASVLALRGEEASPQYLDAIWLDEMTNHYGEAISLDGYASHWARVASFVREPGYPVAYQLGWSLAGHVCEMIARSGHPAQEAYLSVLKAGGRMDYEAAVHRLGATGVESLLHQAYDRAEARLDKVDPRNGGHKRS